MKTKKKPLGILCYFIFLLLLATGCANTVESSSPPPDSPTISEDFSSDGKDEHSVKPTIEGEKPVRNTEPVLTTEALLHFFETQYTENGSLMYEQDLSFKRMIDVMGFDYEEITFSDSSLGCQYVCTNGTVTFHYNRSNGPFDYIVIDCTDHVYEFTPDFKSNMSYDEVTSKIDECSQTAFYGYYGPSEDEDSEYYVAKWITLEYAIEWDYDASNLFKPIAVGVHNSNMWAYTSDPFGWTYDLVTMDGATGEFDYNQYIENIGGIVSTGGPSEEFDGSNNNEGNSVKLPATAYYMFGKSVGEYTLGSDGLYHRTIFNACWGWYNNKPIYHSNSGLLSRWDSSTDCAAKAGQGGSFLPRTVDPNSGYVQCPKDVVNYAWDPAFSNKQ